MLTDRCLASQCFLECPQRLCSLLTATRVLQTVLEQLLVLLSRGREVALVLGLLEAFVFLGNKRTVASQMHRVAAALGPRLQSVLEHLLVPRPNSVPGALICCLSELKPELPADSLRVPGQQCGLPDAPRGCRPWAPSAVCARALVGAASQQRARHVLSLFVAPVCCFSVWKGLLEAFLANKHTVASQMHRVAAALGPRLQSVLEHLSVPRPNSVPGAGCLST